MKLGTQANVVIVEDNVVIADVLEEYVKTDPRLNWVSSYTNCEGALENLLADKPAVVLMDIDLPGMNGIEGTKQIKLRSPKTEVIIVTVFENSETVFSALCAGASGYLTKNVDEKELHNAIEECLSGGAPMSMKIAKMVISSFNKNTISPLNEREKDVLGHLAHGKSYASIADLLFISKDTVKYHIKKIYAILQVNNKEQAIEVASRERYI